MPTNKQKRFQALYEQAHEPFARFCLARVYGDMDYRDLMNETLLVAWEKLDTLRSEAAFSSFLCGIAIRLLAKNKRKRKELKVEDQPQLVEHPSDHASDRNADVYLLYQALAKLPDAQRECLILFEINGFPIREIAALQQASESAVKKRLERGRQGLYQLLREAPAATTKKKELSHG